MIGSRKPKKARNGYILPDEKFSSAKLCLRSIVTWARCIDRCKSSRLKKVHPEIGVSRAPSRALVLHSRVGCARQSA